MTSGQSSAGGKEARLRSLTKAVSWRLVGSIDTFIISFVVTGNAVWAGTIASVEALTKIVLYYLHERVWRRIPWGADDRHHGRALVKGATWRAIGTMDTFMLSWLITGHLGSAASIASIETFTKIALYYLHEQVWARLPWGRAAPRVVNAAGTVAA